MAGYIQDQKKAALPQMTSRTACKVGHNISKLHINQALDWNGHTESLNYTWVTLSDLNLNGLKIRSSTMQPEDRKKRRKLLRKKQMHERHF